MSAFFLAAFSVAIGVVKNPASPATNKAQTRVVGRRLLRGQKRLYLNSCVCFSVKKKKKKILEISFLPEHWHFANAANTNPASKPADIS